MKYKNTNGKDSHQLQATLEQRGEREREWVVHEQFDSYQKTTKEGVY